MAKTRRGAVADYGKYASGLREALEQSGANAEVLVSSIGGNGLTLAIHCYA